MFRINFFVVETFERLAGVRALIDHADKSIPEMERQTKEALKRLAEDQGWEFGEYSVERDLLDDKYWHWVPRYSGYSAVILLYSIVETALRACAERVGKERASAFGVSDMKGNGLDPSVRYIERVTGIDAKKDSAWPHLQDMQALRNILVHRGGRRSTSAAHQNEFDGLVDRCEGLSKASRLGADDEFWVALRLCREFVGQVEDFFKRLFKGLNWPETGVSVNDQGAPEAV